MLVRVMNRSGRPNGSGRPGGAGRRGGGILASVAVAVLAAVTLIATGAPSGASAPGGEAPRPAASHPASAPAPAFAPGTDRGSRAGAGVEADVAYHGHVSLWGGRVGVWLTTENHGPAPVSGVTVRLRFSVPLDPGATLPPGCLRTGPAAVQCGTGTMRAAGSGVRVALDVAVVGEPAEVGVDIDTAWSGGTYDRNPANNTHRVLAPATGDPYSF
ncbi:hypothetical protein ACIOUE_37495 [Streptomyces xanthochromogenes]|uniref:hypothetical protein n=1 Tax=Streptomyces xanthochromogenes TaxID=67384 RepID=UPI0038290BDC